MQKYQGKSDDESEEVIMVEKINPIQKIARFAGLVYLLIAIIAILANFFVLESLIVPGDAAMTANNIMANELLFRSGIVSFMVLVILDVVVAWALYILLKPVNKSLAMLAAWFRLVFATILGIALHNLLSVLQLLSGANYLTVFETEHLQAQATLFLNAFNYTWLIGLTVFGLHLFVLGYLIFKSSYIPRIIGILLVVSSLGYIIDSFANFLLPNYTDYEAIFLLIVAVPAIVAELSLTFWLLLKGVNIEQWEKRAGESV
jgi:hypothetical protein